LLNAESDDSVDKARIATTELLVGRTGALEIADSGVEPFSTFIDRDMNDGVKLSSGRCDPIF
jgi:hypothetical protein